VLRVVNQALMTELSLPAEPDPDAAFTDLGLDSAGVLVVAGELEAEFAIDVPAEALFDEPTPRRLATWLATELDGRRG
jgi:acyl carrier protein